MEEGRVAYDVHIGVLRDKAAQPLHGELVRLGLAHVEGYLVLEVGPAVGYGVVHMHRVPDEVGEEAHRVVVEGLRRVYYHAAGVRVIAPGLRGKRLARRAVHDLPPALYVVAGVHFEQLTADAAHQLYGQRSAERGVEAGHDVALLHLVGIGLGPGVVLASGVVGGIHLGVHLFELLRVIRAVAVAYCVRAPAPEQLKGLGDDIHVCGYGNSSPLGIRFAHSCPPALQRLSVKGLL